MTLLAVDSEKLEVVCKSLIYNQVSFSYCRYCFRIWTGVKAIKHTNDCPVLIAEEFIKNMKEIEKKAMDMSVIMAEDNHD